MNWKLNKTIRIKKRKKNNKYIQWALNMGCKRKKKFNGVGLKWLVAFKSLVGC